MHMPISNQNKAVDNLIENYKTVGNVPVNKPLKIIT